MSATWRVYAWRAFAGFVTVFCALIMQTAVVSRFPLFGVKPDLVLTVAVAFAFGRRPLEGAVFGAMAGVIADVFIGQFIGLNMIVTAAVGFGVSMAGTRLVRETPLFAVVLAIPASIAHSAVYSAGLVLFGMGGNVLSEMLVIALPFAIYNMLLMLGVYPLVRGGQRQFDRLVVLPQRPL